MTTTFILNSKHLGVAGLFFIFAAIQAIAFLFVIVFVKETKGLTPQ